MKPARVRFSPEALDDLENIYDYIAAVNPAAALKIDQNLRAQIRAIGNNSGIGRYRQELSGQLRSLPKGNYVIFYSQKDSYIEIVRVLHGARDVEAMFHPGDDEEHDRM
ncbi:type II toxin-antitoxin system RelE/ParE family toxin [Candidatus Sumerlaeota bacterium]|nr:type II toxin-antitoxin system RelE/ParE family toxin [Candidatus Sumerlaeota bacterium]